MAQKKTSRLKVYVTQIGLDELAVAVRSQRAALDAWGVRQNLFAEGAARVATNEAIISRALKTPGVAVSVTDRAKLQIPLDPKKPKAARPVPTRIAPKQKQRGSSKLDVVAEAEAELKVLEREAKTEREALARRRQDIEDKIETSDRRFAQRRQRLAEKIRAARKAYLAS